MSKRKKRAVRLSPAQETGIRNLRDAGVSTAEICKKMGATVWQVMRVAVQANQAGQRRSTKKARGAADLAAAQAAVRRAIGEDGAEWLVSSGASNGFRVKVYTTRAAASADALKMVVNKKRNVRLWRAVKWTLALDVED